MFDHVKQNIVPMLRDTMRHCDFDWVDVQLPGKPLLEGQSVAPGQPLLCLTRPGDRRVSDMHEPKSSPSVARAVTVGNGLPNREVRCRRPLVACRRLRSRTCPVATGGVGRVNGATRRTRGSAHGAAWLDDRCFMACVSPSI
jgi:hypothetical protein